MKTSTMIAAAVAAALAGGVATAANAPLTFAQIAAATPIYVSGSSAFGTSLEANLITVATFGGANNTLTKWTDSQGYGFSAYSLQVPNPAPADLTNVAGVNIVVYYRTAGGSVWGPGAQAKGVSVGQLGLPTLAFCPGGATTLAAPGGTSSSCTLATGYVLNTDGGGAFAGLQYKPVHWGISDVNVSALKGENWVDANSGAGALGSAQPTASQLNALTPTSAVLFDQVFSVLVNTNGPAGGLATLAKQDITQITSGEAVDWSQIPNAARNGTLGAGAITICRRDAGSGTQTLTSYFFNGTGCSPASFGFPSAGGVIYGGGAAGPTAGVPNQNNSTGNMLKCVYNDANAFGFAVVNTAAAQVTTANPGNGNGGAAGSKVKILGYDGLSPNKTAAANGSYEYWAEAQSVILPGLGAGTEKTVINDLLTRFQDNNQVSAADSVMSTPGLNAADNLPQLPLDVSTNGTPTAIATTNGNLCQQPQSQL